MLVRAKKEAESSTNALQSSSGHGGVSQPSSKNSLLRANSSSSVSSGGDKRSRPPPGTAYSTWYPPLKSTLLVLSKVYRAVDMGVFEDLAQLAVAACAESMKVPIQKKKYTTLGFLCRGVRRFGSRIRA